MVSEVSAQEPTFPTDRFPPHTTVVRDGVRYEAFDLGGFRSLLSLDSDLYYALRENEQLRTYKLSCDTRLVALQQVLDTSSQQLDILRVERDRLYKDWREENIARHQAENKPRLGSWLGFTAAGVFGITTAVLATILITR